MLCKNWNDSFFFLSVPPKLYESLPNNSITINESDTLELRCKAKGNPLPVITWTKDSKFILQSNTYTKENASRYDAGVYRCTANNTIVKAVYSETTVIVNCKSFLMSNHILWGEACMPGCLLL